jgi:hypothetical protein
MDEVFFSRIVHCLSLLCSHLDNKKEMSHSLFNNCEESLQRLESLLEAKFKKYNLVACKDKHISPSTGEPVVFYTAQITFTDRAGYNGYHSIDGNSFPDLYDKISNLL